ncbi:MAG: MATE family efflux transporter [Treponema sp.]|nr:MATE family efflux transporter [Treponema sp.]
MKRTRIQNVANYVIPTILSSCCFFLFTVVDGIFVGRGVNMDALGALNIALPFVLTVNAFTMLVTIGGVTITAIRLGRGDSEGANQAFMHSFSCMSLVSLLLCLGGICFSPRIALILGAGGSYFDYAAGYLFWYAVFLIPSQMSMLLQGFCRNDRAPRLVTAAVIVSTSINIFLDWLFIFPLQKGVRGAAVATGISQIVSLLIVLSHFLRGKGSLRIRKFTPDCALWRKIILRGLPEMAAQFSTPITTFCMNYTLMRGLGQGAVNAFAIINYVTSFSGMVFFGTSEGLQPLFGRSYGSKNEKDLKYYFRTGILINLTVCAVILVLLVFIGGAIYRLFGADKAACGIIADAMPKFSWSFFVLSFNTIISAYLYSTKRTKEAVIINVCRGLLFNSLIISTFPLLFGGAVVWFTVGIAESLSLVIALALLIYSERGGVKFR